MLTDDLGREVVFEDHPQRIVSLGPSVTQTIIAIGGTNQLVARSQFGVYPKEAAELPSVGAIDQPSLEEIIVLKPDAVIALEFLESGHIEKLEKASIPVFIVKFSTADDVYRSTEKIAQILGEKAEENASEMLKGWRDLERSIADKVGKARKPAVLVSLDWKDYYSGGKGSYLHELIQVAGGNNVAATAPSVWPQLSEEAVVGLQPEILIVTAEKEEFGEIAAKLRQRKKDDQIFAALPAVRENRLYLIDGAPLFVPGPRFEEGVRLLTATIHPEKFQEEYTQFVSAGRLEKVR